jgi:hypothetical protein
MYKERRETLLPALAVQLYRIIEGSVLQIRKKVILNVLYPENADGFCIRAWFAV